MEKTPSAKIWCFAGYIVDFKNALKKDQKPRLWNVAFIIGQALGKSKKCSTSYKSQMDIHSSLVNGYIKSKYKQLVSGFLGRSIAQIEKKAR